MRNDHSSANEYLARLLIDYYDHEERERGKGKVRERNHACAQRGIQKRDVAQANYNYSLYDPSNDTWNIIHANDRHSHNPCPSDEQIGPLDDKYRDHEATLGVNLGLTCVADLIVRYVRLAPEIG